MSSKQPQQQDYDAWSNIPEVDEDEVISKEASPALLNESRSFGDKRVPTIVDYKRMVATLEDMLNNQLRDSEEYAYHVEQERNYMENQIFWERREEDLQVPENDAPVFYGPQRNPNEPLTYLYNKDFFYLKNGNTKEKKYVLSLHKIHATPFLEDDLVEHLTRWVRKEFRTFNKEARLSIQHYKDTWHNMYYIIMQRNEKLDPKEVFTDHKIIDVVKITTDKQYGLEFMEEIIMKRDENKPYSFSEVDFKYLNKNNIEDMYYLCLNNKVNYRENELLNSLNVFIRSCVIWKRVHDYQLGFKIYQIKVNLTAPTLTILGIEKLALYFVVTEPSVGIVYVKSEKKRRIMSLTEISKFCDATLERVRKEVSLILLK
ncbi:hypothetical protein Tco_0589825 [Tanacetum coccineum]